MLDARVTHDPATRDLASRADIEHLVRAFYRDAAMDDLLGPIFSAARVDWPHHIATLTDFWSWQLLGERGYAGNPLRAHEPVHARTPFETEHYERWLALFEETVDDHFAGPNADTAKERARRMARALQRLLDGTSAPGDAPLTPILTRRAAG
ncbi:MAG: hypothetical protein AMXMBFR46_23680 [Acidimicrobiia bacterium]